MPPIEMTIPAGWGSPGSIRHLESLGIRVTSTDRHGADIEFDSRLTVQEVEDALPDYCRLVDVVRHSDRPQICTGRVDAPLGFNCSWLDEERPYGGGGGSVRYNRQPVYGTSGLIGHTAGTTDYRERLVASVDNVEPEMEDDARLRARIVGTIVGSPEPIAPGTLSELQTSSGTQLDRMARMAGLGRRRTTTIRTGGPSTPTEVESDEALRERCRAALASVMVPAPPLPTELETASGDWLDRVASNIYGVNRRAATTPTIDVTYPGYIGQIKVEAKFVSSAPARTIWERLLDEEEAAA